MKNTAIAVAVLIALGILIWFALGQKPPVNMSAAETPETEKSKTPENATSKPAPKPSTSMQDSATAETSGIVMARYSQKVTTLGVSLAPLEVTEDSRCPSNATCIRAGTIKVRTHIEGETTDAYFELGKPVSVGGATITLTHVTPLPKIGEAIGSTAYRFTYEVKKQ